MSDLARRGGDLARPKDPGKRDALDLLPGDWADTARPFYGFFSDYLKGTSGLASRLRVWMSDPDVRLTLPEARAAMRRLMKPVRSKEFQYVGQIMAALAEEVEAIVKRRRDRQAVEDFRRRQEAAAKHAAPAAVKDLLKTFGKLDD